MERALKLSIIIPVYNIEAYIEQTILSCEAQDMAQSDYEIICVDDGSPDGSTRVIRSLQERFSNIRLVSQENAGVSAARNKGIELAQGEYIWFVDGDDIVAPNCLNKIASALKSSNADLFWFQMRRFHREPDFENCTFEFEVCKEDGKNKYDFMFAKGGGGVCCHWFKTAFIKENHFSFHTQIRYSEDVLFSYAALRHCQTCAKTKDVYYYYRQRETSAIHDSNPEAFAASLHSLAREYNELSLQEEDAFWKEKSLYKRDLAVSAMLFTLMRNGNTKIAKKAIQELSKEGFYPYPLKKELFKGNETKTQFVINAVSFLLPLKGYFLLCTTAFALLNKFKRR